jgi:uncharacterized protein (TIGR02246 family)
MTTADDAAIRELLRELTDAWDRGDANAYSARFRADGTFTNVNGTFHVGRDEFEQRHNEVFRGFFKGTTLTLSPKFVRLVEPGVALADIDVGIFGCPTSPPGVKRGADGALRTCLLMVLVNETGLWRIAAYHNVWQAALAYDRG